MWFLLIFVYFVIASALPVNFLLQPRDYLNSFLLYFGLIVGGLAAIIAVKGFDSLPATTSFSAVVIGGKPTPFWPAVPLVIACGALSGFHALVASGTSSKQLREEKDALFYRLRSNAHRRFPFHDRRRSIAAFGIAAMGEAMCSNPRAQPLRTVIWNDGQHGDTLLFTKLHEAVRRRMGLLIRAHDPRHHEPSGTLSRAGNDHSCKGKEARFI